MIKELAKALKRRGFLITLMDDHIYFHKGNAESELFLLKEMFRELNIAVKIENRKIYLLENSLDQGLLDQIIWYRASNHEAGGGSGWASWRYFIKRNHGPKINTFVLETGVSLLVKAISAAGIVPICSCDGHGRRTPFIALAWKHNAIWFSILLDEIKDKLRLNYEWYFHNNDHRDISFVAKRKPEGWDLEQILEDTYQMAEYFLNESERLSTLKKDIFGGKYKSTTKIVREMDYDQLYEWMVQKYKNHLLKLGD
jgi:hypothetical protein